MQPNYIAGYDTGGLVERVKPFKLPNEAFATLNNAYVVRDRVQKRDGLKKVGDTTDEEVAASASRLRRVLSGESLGNTDGSGNFTGDLITDLSLEATATIQPGSVEVTDGTNTFSDDGAGGLTGAPAGTGTINYATTDITITGGAAAAALTIDVNYYPGLPAMGIRQRERPSTNQEQTVFFDTKYAYIFTSGDFQELATGTEWSGSDSEFFWTCNYRGTEPYDRLFFVTNNNFPGTDPMRYYNTSWNDFTPRLNDTGTVNYLLTALILLPYYGRLIALNVVEGTELGTGNRIVNRCRFSQVGSPIQAYSAGPPIEGAWLTDVFGKGGFIDAPTSQAIIGASFVKNTLVVRFERSTWQLRYVGDYGLPFVWERISSDFGSESTFSDVIFDDGVISVGQKAITKANGVTVARVDEAIPDKVFDINNLNDGNKRVHGYRDYKKEMCYWCYPQYTDSSGFDIDTPIGYYPYRVLIYNYINGTWAVNRDNITCFGEFQSTTNTTWDSLTVLWDDLEVTWDDTDTQAYFPSVVCGNQQGYIHYYNYSSIEDSSLFVQSISGTTLTVPKHNLVDGEYVSVSGGMWSTSAPADSDIGTVVVVDDDTITVTTYSPGTGDYLGGSEITLYPQMYIQTKDFCPYLENSGNLKLTYVDFLLTTSPDGEFSVETYVNTSQSTQGNLLTGQRSSETNLPSPYYIPNSDISWHRFYATIQGQFVRIIITYNDEQMKDVDIQNSDFVMHAMRFWTRPGGSVIF